MTFKMQYICTQHYSITHIYLQMYFINTSHFIAIESSPVWILQDATFEKMGMHMAENDGRLLALFDELSTFLTKIRLYSSRGLTDSHELSMFLELYNANPWTRTTGISLASYRVY